MNSFALKMVALLTMIVDHIGYEFTSVFNTMFLRQIGRVAMPIYCFLIAEGCRKTSNLKKYLLRLGMFAFISEIPFDLFASRKVFWFEHQNVFFTLFLGAAAVFVYEEFKKRIDESVEGKKGIYLFMAAVISLCSMSLIAYLLKTDYDIYGVAAVFLCYLAEHKVLRVLNVLIVFIAFYHSQVFFMIGATVACLLMLCYNGKRGPSFKYLFYAAYPVHLLIIYAFYNFIYLK